jgi:hypothetical protein
MELAMPFSFRKMTRLNLMALLLLIAIAIGVFAARTALKPSVPAVSFKQGPNPEFKVEPKNKDVTTVESEVISLTPFGFEPKEIKRPKGLFCLMVNTRLGLKEVNLRLDRDLGNGVKEKQKEKNVKNDILDWQEFLDLNPGTYILSESSLPKFTCTLTITAK